MVEDRMQRQRFERKYLISEEMASATRDFVSSQLELDEFGIGKPNLSYPVHSLYLDSDSLATYWMTVNGDKNRFKLRMRFYDSQPDSPVFFEIKRRVDDVIMKQRGGVRKEAVHLILEGQMPEPHQMLSASPRHLFAIERFCEITQSIQASPKVHVAYQREAWVDPASDAVRVTFDREVRGEAEPTTRFLTEMSQPVRPFLKEVILEIKFTDRFPNWLREMVEQFDLVRSGAAKYCECVDLIGRERLGAQLRANLSTDDPLPPASGDPGPARTRC